MGTKGNLIQLEIEFIFSFPFLCLVRFLCLHHSYLCILRFYFNSLAEHLATPPPTLHPLLPGPEATAFVPHVRGRDRGEMGEGEVPESLLQPLPAAILTALRRESFRLSIRLSIRLSFRLSVSHLSVSLSLSLHVCLSVRPVNRSHL